MKSERAPNDSTSVLKRVSMPETNAAMTMTVVVPTTTPRIVRNDRRRWERSVSNAMRMFSRISDLDITAPSFGAQRLDRVEPGGAPRRVDPGHEAYGRRHRDCNKGPHDRQGGRH